jgi:hypothetical protein
MSSYNSYILKALLLICFQINIFAQTNGSVIEGEYLYKYGDNETLLEAKALCYNMALRNAIEANILFVSSTTEIKNYTIRNDIIQSLSSGYVYDLKIIEERVEKGDNEIFYKLKGKIKPQEFKDAVKKVVKRKTGSTKLSPVYSGKYLEIVNIIDKGDFIKVVYKKKGDQHEFAYKNSIFITYFDEDGIPLGGDKIKSEFDLSPNEYRTLSFNKLEGAKSYEIRVTK